MPVTEIIDLIFLLCEGHKLGTSELQFAYKQKISTTTCSWAATTIIEHFNKIKGVPLYGAAMDMSRALDNVLWPNLFSLLLKKKINGIFLRILLFIYERQTCLVKWNGVKSTGFPVSNGVRQGSISSAILFIIYIDKLIDKIKQMKIGCHIDSVFVGILISADDILLLCPNRSGLQIMINACEKFAKENNLSFGTNPDPKKSKTKCIIFSNNRRECTNIAPIQLCGNNLPWVKNLNHLGITLESNNSMSRDIMRKTGQFIGNINSILQELHICDPETLMKVIETQACSFYGPV